MRRHRTDHHLTIVGEDEVWDGPGANRKTAAEARVTEDLDDPEAGSLVGRDSAESRTPEEVIDQNGVGRERLQGTRDSREGQVGGRCRSGSCLSERPGAGHG